MTTTEHHVADLERDHDGTSWTVIQDPLTAAVVYE
jgi:hypothetical protein